MTKEEEQEKDFQEWQSLSEEEKDEKFLLSTLSYYETIEYFKNKKEKETKTHE